MRRILTAGVAALATALMSIAAHAQSAYPSKSVRAIVPYPAGGSLDTLTRILTDKLSQKWGQTIVVENHGGGSGMIGTDLAVRSPADGYTLLFTASSEVSLNTVLFAQMPYDPQADLEPVTMLVSVPVALLANGRSQAGSLQDFIERAKSDAGLSYGTPGIGTPQQFAGELLQRDAQIELTHIPYKGAAPFIQDLLGSHVEFGFLGISSVVPQIKSGEIKALALATAERSAILPDVPTFVELGYPQVRAGQWLAVWTPKGVDAAIVAQLNRDLLEALSQPDVTERVYGMGLDIVGSTPEELAQVQAADIELYRQVAADIGIKPE